MESLLDSLGEIYLENVHIFTFEFFTWTFNGDRILWFFGSDSILFKQMISFYVSWWHRNTLRWLMFFYSLESHVYVRRMMFVGRLRWLSLSSDFTVELSRETYVIVCVTIRLLRNGWWSPLRYGPFTPLNVIALLKKTFDTRILNKQLPNRIK